MSRTIRATGWLATVAVLLGGCSSTELPPPSPTAAGTPAPVASSETPSTAPSGIAPATVIARFPFPVVDVAADGGDAWYIRDDGPGGRIGHVTAAGTTPREAMAGPTPVAIAAAPDAVYVLEGVPDDALRKGLPRTGVLEKLDRATLRVRASAPISGLPVDVAVEDGRVWVGGVAGRIDAFDATTLERSNSRSLTGRGPSLLAVGGGSVWMLNGLTEEQTFLVHRIEPGTGVEQALWRVPGDGVDGHLAVGGRVWVAAPGGNGTGMLYPVSLTGDVGQPLPTAATADLATESGSLWSLSTDADVVRLDEATLEPSASVRLGDVGQAIAVSGARVWAASEDLIALAVAP